MKNQPMIANCYPDFYEQTSYLVSITVYNSTGEEECGNAWVLATPNWITATDLMEEVNSYRSQGFWVNVFISRNGIVRKRLIFKPYRLNYTDIHFDTLFD